MRIYLPPEIERKFRKVSMESYGYSRGSFSKAATAAIMGWIRTREALAQVEIPDEPVKAVRGLLRHVKKNSVELQHDVAEIRAESAKGA